MSPGESIQRYAGIGSRRAPSHILGLCGLIAHTLRGEGWTLRSGHAIGCDQAFEYDAEAEAEVFLPWRDFESDVLCTASRVRLMPSIEAIEMVERVHPTPARLSMASVRLHARNCHIILGDDLGTPVDRVICFTADEHKGGTAFGLRLARQRRIPIDNLADPKVFEHYSELVSP